MPPPAQRPSAACQTVRRDRGQLPPHTDRCRLVCSASSRNSKAEVQNCWGRFPTGGARELFGSTADRLLHSSPVLRWRHPVATDRLTRRRKAAATPATSGSVDVVRRCGPPGSRYGVPMRVIHSRSAAGPYRPKCGLRRASVLEAWALRARKLLEEAKLASWWRCATSGHRAAGRERWTLRTGGDGEMALGTSPFGDVAVFGSWVARSFAQPGPVLVLPGLDRSRCVAALAPLYLLVVTSYGGHFVE